VTEALSIPVHLVVRYACECAALATWHAGIELPELVLAAEAADRVDFIFARDAAVRAANAIRLSYYGYTDAANGAYYAYNAAHYAAATGSHVADFNFVSRAYNDHCRTMAGNAASSAADYAGGRDGAREQCARRAMELFGLHGGRELRYRVAAHIEAHPELHDQAVWGDGAPNRSCNTPCCAAGWACHLGGGSRGLPVPLAAAALLYTDDAPLPRFDGVVSRRDVLAALRGS